MIEEVKTIRFRAVCDNCGRSFPTTTSRSAAETNLLSHECGVHRRAYDSTGGYRGVLGWRDSCICGESWSIDGPSQEFQCPAEARGK